MGWRLGTGREFPGAKGILSLDSQYQREGRDSLRLEGDFSDGGEYVEASTLTPTVNPISLSFWIKSPDVRKINMRFIDGTGQVHQTDYLSLSETGVWQRIEFSLTQLNGGHWGGANDGKWHDPIKGFSILLNKKTLPESSGCKGSLWIGWPVFSFRSSVQAEAFPKGVEVSMTADSGFETPDFLKKWRYYDGHEFPGAKGGISIDKIDCGSGKSSMKLVCDFSGGGAYVAAFRNFSDLMKSVEKINLKYKTDNLKTISMRAADSTGQWFQKNGIPVQSDGQWHDLSIAVSDIVKGGHFGGANDGAFHWPNGEIGFLLDKKELVDASTSNTALWIDDVSVIGFSSPVSIEQTAFGNIFVEPEQPSFKFVSLRKKGGDCIQWKVRDFHGDTILKGETVIQGERILKIPDAPKGFFRLEVDVLDNGKLIDRLSTSASFLAPLPSNMPKESPFGICTHLAYQPPNTLIPLIAKAGITEVRDEILWEYVEKQKNKLEMPLKHMTFIKELIEAGLNPLIILCYGNRNYENGFAPYNEEMYKAFARYAEFVAAGMPKGVKAVEIWNEWFCKGFCKGPANSKVEPYHQMLKETVEAIRKANPDLKIIGCCIMNLRWGGWEWLTKFFSIPQSLDLMDAVSIHPYWCEAEPEYLTEWTEHARKLMRDTAGTEKPLWSTEVGWTQANPGGNVAEYFKYLASDNKIVTDETGASYFVRAYILQIAAGAEKVYWYDFMNDGLDPKDKEHHFGIVRNVRDPQGPCVPKPAYAACATMTRCLLGSKFVKGEDMPEGAFCFKFDRNGTPVRVVWSIHASALGVESKVPFDVVDIMGNAKNLKPKSTPSILNMRAGEPVYIVGNVDRVFQAVSVSVPELQLAASGENLHVSLKICNLTHESFNIGLEINGKPFEFKATPSLTKTETVVLPEKREEELVKLPASISINGIPSEILLVRISVEKPISVSFPASFISDSTLGLSLRNLSVAPKTIESASWNIGGKTGEKKLNISIPSGTEEVIELPVADIVEHTELPLELSFTVKGDNTPVIQKTKVSRNPCSRKKIKFDGVLGEWGQLPFVDLEKAGTVMMKEHRGSNDLGGRFAIAYDNGFLYLAAEIRDDIHNQSNSDDQVWQGDSIQFAFTDKPMVNSKYYELTAALTPNGAEICVLETANGESCGLRKFPCSIVRDGNLTRYEIAIPLKELKIIDPDKTRVFGFSFLVNDNDGSGRRGWIEWGSGIGIAKNPSLYKLLYLKR